MSDAKLFILDNIPFLLHLDKMLDRMRVKPDDPRAEMIERLVDQAQSLGRPKALYRESYVEARGDDTVVIDGVTFTSRVLAVNLADAHRVFPYIATCGKELDEWSAGLDDPLDRFWVDGIKETMLGSAAGSISEHIDQSFMPGKTASMNPGSLEDWPLDQQGQLFEVLGDPMAAIGVELTDSFLMIPTKSVSGMHFPTETSFENCQLCSRERCPGRRAKYDKDLFDKRYATGTD